MCSYHEIQPNGKEHELFKVYFKYGYICLFLPVSVKHNHHMKKIHSCIFLPLSFSPFLFLVLPFLNLTDGDFSLLNPFGSEVEPLLSLNKSIVLHVLKGRCPEKQRMDLFQLKKQANTSLAVRGNQMYNLCSRVNRTFLRKYT